MESRPALGQFLRSRRGRGGHPSDSVLDAIATALSLDDAERAHLYDLARPVRPRRRASRPERIRPELQVLVDALDRVPAFVLGRRMDVLAWNRLAAALIVDFGSLAPEQRNMPKLVLLDEGMRGLHGDWETGARDAVAYLQLMAGRHPDDAGLAALIGELSMKSEDFRRWWARHDVRDKTHGVKRLEHPIVGPLTLFYETLALRGDPDQVLVAYVAEPGSESETALALLDSMLHGQRRTEPRVTSPSSDATAVVTSPATAGPKTGAVTDDRGDEGCRRP